MGVSFEVVDLAMRIDYPTQTSRKKAREKGERKGERKRQIGEVGERKMRGKKVNARDEFAMVTWISFT